MVTVEPILMPAKMPPYLVTGFMGAAVRWTASTRSPALPSIPAAGTTPPSAATLRFPWVYAECAASSRAICEAVADKYAAHSA